MRLEKKTVILDQDGVFRALMRMAHQILEKNRGCADVCLIGIKTRGVPLAAMLAENIRAISATEVPVGEIDITLYRDDLSKKYDTPVVCDSQVPFSVENKTVILVDDVIYTGRTARAAMDAVMELGRPSRIQLLVMIDRGHRELPIRPDYVGKNIPTSHSEVVSVKLEPTDSETNVWLYDCVD